jgi:hypothetical protein
MANKVIISIACNDTIKSKTASALVQALHNCEFEYDFIISQGCDLIGSRTRLVREAIKRGGTHMLFVDHDMYFPPVTHEDGSKENPISRLLSHKKDVVGVPYNFRQLPLRTTAIPLGTEPVDGKYVVTPEELPKELFKVQGLGTGFLLINLSVFDKIEKPWFQFGRTEDGELLYGEDTWLVHQCMKAGIDFWADPLLQVKHLGEFSY